MIAWRLRFLTGRVHATPWGSHVNEGQVEWPPSPWRLLRALVATWHRSAREDVDEATVRRLLDAHVRPPTYVVPHATPAHVRHYMPKGGGKTTNVVDAFVAVVRGGEAQCSWVHGVLSEADRAGLALILSRITHVGRAEALVEVELVAEGISNLAAGVECAPVGEPGVGRTVELPIWDGSCAEGSLGWLALAGSRPKVARGAAPRGTSHPLIVETGALRAARHDPSRPPGMAVARYRFAADPFAAAPQIRDAALRPRESVAAPVVVRLTLGGAVLPRRTDTIRVAAAVRAAVMRRYQDATGRRPAFLSGKDAQGSPASGHLHPYYLPWCGRGDDAVTDVFVYAAGGMPPDVLRAITGVSRLTIGDGDHRSAFRVVCAGAAPPATANWALARAARRWISVTPFVGGRHPKVRRESGGQGAGGDTLVDGPEHQLLRELRLRGLAPSRVTVLPRCTASSALTPWHRFEARRSSSSARYACPAVGFEIEFGTEILGPLLLGASAHFGLGQFLPA